MSSPITISIYHKGRQKDYEAIFTNNRSSYEFKVFIDNNIINFVGSLEKSFLVKPKTVTTYSRLIHRCWKP